MNTELPGTGDAVSSSVEDAVRNVLSTLGLTLDNPELQGTSKRIAETLRELLGGIHLDAGSPLRRGEPAPEGIGVIALKNLEFRSLCAHHFLPFSGVASIAYSPADRIVGIGSIVRSLDILSTRPQVQERLGQELAECLVTDAQARGAVVVLCARHSCISDRGPREATATLTTVSAAGLYLDPRQQREALDALDFGTV